MPSRDPDAPAKSPNNHSRRDRRRAKSKKERAKLANREALRSAAADGRHYATMARVVVAALPDHAPGVPVGSVLEAARRNTSRRQFPGDTHRIWARRVLDDLVVKGTVAAAPEGLYLRHHAAA